MAGIYLDINKETRRMLLDQHNETDIVNFPNTNSTKEKKWCWIRLEEDKDFKCERWRLCYKSRFIILKGDKKRLEGIYEE